MLRRNHNVPKLRFSFDFVFYRPFNFNYWFIFSLPPPKISKKSSLLDVTSQLHKLQMTASHKLQSKREITVTSICGYFFDSINVYHSCLSVSRMINVELVSMDTCNEPYSIKFFLHQASSPDKDTCIYLAAALFMYEFVCVPFQQYFSYSELVMISVVS